MSCVFTDLTFLRTTTALSIQRNMTTFMSCGYHYLNLHSQFNYAINHIITRSVVHLQNYRSNLRVSSISWQWYLLYGHIYTSMPPWTFGTTAALSSYYIGPSIAVTFIEIETSQNSYLSGLSVKRAHEEKEVDENLITLESMYVIVCV